MPTPTTPRTDALMLRGSLIVLKRKCGKSGCHCAQGSHHETPALSYSVAGSTKILTLRYKDIPQVKAALERYRSALDALEQKALAGIAALKQRIETQKAAERGNRR